MSTSRLEQRRAGSEGPTADATGDASSAIKPVFGHVASNDIDGVATCPNGHTWSTRYRFDSNRWATADVPVCAQCGFSWETLSIRNGGAN